MILYYYRHHVQHRIAEEQRIRNFREVWRAAALQASIRRSGSAGSGSDDCACEPATQSKESLHYSFSARKIPQNFQEKLQAPSIEIYPFG